MSGADEPRAQGVIAPRSQRRHRDTERFILRFAELTGFRVHSDNVGALPLEFLARKVPSPAALMQAYSCELELRTRNALCQFDPREREDSWTFGRLLELRGFGVFSLIDLLQALTEHGAFIKEG
jgi:hypothetical protein